MSWQNEDKNIFCCFIKGSLNFRAHALQSELNKFSIWNFVRFWLQSMSSKIKWAFEKTTKNVFCLHFAVSNFNIIFWHFQFNFNFFFFISQIFNKFISFIPFFKILMTVINMDKNRIFKKVYLPLKPTCRSCFFSFSLLQPKTKTEPPNIQQ